MREICVRRHNGIWRHSDWGKILTSDYWPAISFYYQADCRLRVLHVV